MFLKTDARSLGYDLIKVDTCLLDEATSDALATNVSDTPSALTVSTSSTVWYFEEGGMVL